MTPQVYKYLKTKNVAENVCQILSRKLHLLEVFPARRSKQLNSWKIIHCEYAELWKKKECKVQM